MVDFVAKYPQHPDVLLEFNVMKIHQVSRQVAYSQLIDLQAVDMAFNDSIHHAFISYCSYCTAIGSGGKIFLIQYQLLRSGVEHEVACHGINTGFDHDQLTDKGERNINRIDIRYGSLRESEVTKQFNGRYSINF